MAYTNPVHTPATGAVIPASWGLVINANMTALSAGFSVPLFPRSSGEVAASGLQAAAYSVVQSSGAGTIKPQYPVLAFDKDTDEGRIWSFVVPRLYGTTITVQGAFYTTVTSGTVVFAAQLAAITDGDAGVTAKVFDTVNTDSAVTVPGTAGTEETFSITMTNADSATADDRCMLALFRDVSGDTAAADILLTRLDVFFALAA